MDAIEKAIRNAFAKGNAEDRAFREKVYRSAFAALDRVLQANPNVTVEAAINRRKAVQAKIAEIESEFLPAVQAVPDVTLPSESGTPAGNAAPAPSIDTPTQSPAPSVDAPRPPAQAAPSPSITVDGPVQPDASDAPRSRVLPRVPDIMPDETALPDAPTLDDSPGASVGNGAEVAPDRDERRIRGRRLPLTAIFVVATLLAAAGIGGYFAFQTGVFKTAAELDTGPPEAPPTLEGEESSQPADTGSPQKPGEADQSKNWINVFSPADPTHVSTPSDAGAEVMKDDTGQFLRIRSGASGSAIAFDVGQGVLEKLAGKHAMFDVIARSEEGKETQISVDCNFGEFGDCGRKRYAVGHERNEYLFDVQFPNKHPGAAGTIAINSDFDKQGKSVDIYEIRVSIAE
ncbi:MULTISPECIES: hypothetical protein [unclassified Mesorhizobium]|uniref:hypothetical protein n=1 Tax=unclassified Mesorhizobium TaxID=325217 RepID=UPI000F760A5A|nr:MULTISPECIES: hypothetical protein [unclassified Mesorhizobium]AZO20156.1 hypothetical protein EJ070_05435 [Mesorhizobium sp. M1E.F.Ca.ET.045.02.1.1]RUW22154.1 hypothetical protein EOA38_31360 [Mesorhizobium sp. M1E.F.Ca.ET.041.01.1.1]RUW83666.1 hypothetical protein EOA29_12430 [Mesorhizobium sp. M1E.F.Ca.ET.063.01.1.1]RWD86871.1 MAG: hypothetical protein EOS39_26475 [Mesorhizobium sp.]RWD89584.1 MAG: hypothetical protein EOS38_11430 [Mesorhizobium sp.]